jgi:hypothetical protein
LELLFDITKERKIVKRKTKREFLLVLPFYLIVHNKTLLFVTILGQFPKEFVVVVTK